VRIVYLADAPYPHTWRWVRHFAALGHDCHVISFRPADIDGATVHHIDGIERLGKARYLVHARRVKRLVERLQPDILHAMHLTSYGFLGALTGFQPLVLSPIGTDILEAPRLSPFHAWLTRYSLARARAITATGLHLATETTRYTPLATPVTVVPYGVDLQRFRPVERHRDGPLTVGAVLRLSPEKGLSYLVEAFAELRRRYGDKVRLRIAGNGPERAPLEALIRRLSLEQSVELCGWLEYDAVPAFLAGLDIFCLPSTYEGFGVAAVEASACSLPVVASRVHGIPDVVRHGATGLLVPPAVATALAEALGELVDDSARRHVMGEAGRRYVAAHYDWQRNAHQMELVYERVVAEARTTGARADQPAGRSSAAH
jgi:glycosyltransferase involved in cell wall biosynthesis